MKESGKTMVTVHGRIGTVTWLEKAPYNAVKERDGKFFCYRLTVDDGAIKNLLEDLEDVEKVWSKEFPLYEREMPHPAYAGIAEGFKKNPALQNQLQLRECQFGPDQIDNDECEEFALLQIFKVIERAKASRRHAIAEEAQRIYDEVEERGGEAYGEYKARLQELNSK